ncbi:hypothetical protein C0J52_08713 [Blattella germanica]|nr:hypothetical protein C0J52_08713 [Blattella germanica]
MGNVAKPSAFEVHKFIENELGFNEDQLDTIQLVARDKAVYIKVISTTLMQRVLNKYNGIINFKYDNGEIVEELKSTVLRRQNLRIVMLSELLLKEECCLQQSIHLYKVSAPYNNNLLY